ncbi:MAG: tetratricopeptide repeat protein [bacterium]
MKSSYLITISILFIIALSMNIIFIFSIGLKSPLLLPINPDSKMYYDLASQISNGNLTTGKPFFVAPLYPYFVGLIFYLFGKSVPLMITIQIIMGSFIPVIIYLTSRNLFNNIAGIISGLLSALYFPLIIYNSQLLSVTLEVFLISISLFLITRKDTSFYSVLFAGLIAGITALARPNIAIIPLFVIIAFFILRKSIGTKKVNIYSVLFTVTVIIAILPATIHNIVVSGDLIPITTHGGVNFYIGNNPSATGAFHAPPGFPASPLEVVDSTSTSLAEEEVGKKLSPKEVSDFYFKKGFDYIKNNPKEALILNLKKLLLITNHYELSLNINLYFYRIHSILRFLPLITYGIIFPIGIIGLIIGLRENRRSVILVAYFLTCFLTLIPFIINDKYRIIFTVPLFVSSGIIIYKIYNYFKLRSYKNGLILTVIILISLIFCNLTIFDLKPGINFDRCYLTIAEYLFDNGNYNKAKLNLENGLKYNQKNDKVWLLYGLCFVKENNITDAEISFRNSIKANPNNYKARYNLGILLIQERKQKEAIEELNIAHKISPDYLPATLALIDLYLQSGDTNKAEMLITSLEHHQRNIPALRYRLGTIKFGKDDITGAIYELSLAGDYPDAHRLLSRCYLKIGNIDRAVDEILIEERLYPKNPLLEELRMEIDESQKKR